MFSFFNRTNIQNWELDLIKSLIRKLPRQYLNLLEQLNSDLIKGVILNASDIEGYVAFRYNFSSLKKYEIISKSDFKFTNITVRDVNLKKLLSVELYVSCGVLSGYSIYPKKSKYKLDLTTLDVSDLTKEYIGENDYQRIVHLLNDEEKKILSNSEVYSITLQGKEFFHIKSLEDGDFLGIDLEKNIYHITHDPYEIKELNNSLINNLNSFT